MNSLDSCPSCDGEGCAACDQSGVGLAPASVAQPAGVLGSVCRRCGATETLQPVVLHLADDFARQAGMDFRLQIILRCARCGAEHQIPIQPAPPHVHVAYWEDFEREVKLCFCGAWTTNLELALVGRQARWFYPVPGARRGLALCHAVIEQLSPAGREPKPYAALHDWQGAVVSWLVLGGPRQFSTEEGYLDAVRRAVERFQAKLAKAGGPKAQALVTAARDGFFGVADLYGAPPRLYEEGDLVLRKPTLGEGVRG